MHLRLSHWRIRLLRRKERTPRYSFFSTALDARETRLEPQRVQQSYIIAGIVQVFDLLEVGIDSDSSDISSQLATPCFEATALYTEVSESNFCLQLQLECQASGPLVQQDLQAK